MTSALLVLLMGLALSTHRDAEGGASLMSMVRRRVRHHPRVIGGFAHLPVLDLLHVLAPVPAGGVRGAGDDCPNLNGWRVWKASVTAAVPVSRTGH